MATDLERQRGARGETDWPAGHPARSDTDSKDYVPPEPLFTADWDKGHPAREGANVSKDWRGEQHYASGEAREE